MTETKQPPRLRSLSGFTREIQVPNELAFAFATDRIELLRMIKPKPLTETEAAKLYEVIEVLMETNQALRRHVARLTTLTQDLSESVEEIVAALVDIRDTVAHARKATAQIKQIADFRDTDDED